MPLLQSPKQGERSKVQLTVVSSQRLLKHAKKRWVMLYSTIQHIVKKKMHAHHKFFNWIALANLIFETLVRIRPHSGKPNPIRRLQQFPARFIYNEGLTIDYCTRVRRGYWMPPCYRSPGSILPA